MTIHYVPAGQTDNLLSVRLPPKTPVCRRNELPAGEGSIATLIRRVLNDGIAFGLGILWSMLNMRSVCIGRHHD